MSTKESINKEAQHDTKQNSKVGNTLTNKYTTGSQKLNLKDKQNKGNGKEKVDRKTVLSDLNKNNN